VFGNFNRLGPGGAPALGELLVEQSGRIDRMIPSADDCKAILSSGTSKIVCVGTGYSAITTLSNIIDAVRQTTERCQLIWISQKTSGIPPYHIIKDDPLQARSTLSSFGNALALGHLSLPENLTFMYLPETTILEFSSLEPDSTLSMVIDSYNHKMVTLRDITHLIANVGYKPNLDMIRELDIHLCYRTEGPMRLSSALLSQREFLGESPDCLKQHSFGSSSLITTEDDFYILGAKSYGRLSTFILRIGIEQITEIVNLLSVKSDSDTIIMSEQ